MRRIGLFLLVLLLLTCGKSVCLKGKSGHPKKRPLIIWSNKHFDMRRYYLNIECATTKKGATRKALVNKAESRGVRVVYATNFTFFCSHNDRTPIGSISRDGVDLSQCTLGYRRVSFWQKTEAGIALYVPDNTLLCAEAGPWLIHNGCLVLSLQGFEAAFWSDYRLRNFVAIIGHDIHLIRATGTLWDVAKWLRKHGYKEGMNLDGGSSCSELTLISNILYVADKSEREYQNYLNSQQQQAWWEQVVKPTQTPHPPFLSKP